METLWGWEVVEAVQGVHKGGKRDSLVNGVSTDTRLMKAGELFVAIPGNKYDGHAFVPQALEKGASGLLVSKEVSNVPSDILLVEVKDTVEALGKLAKYYREKLPVKVVAVTGTNGKTSTKEMLYHLFSPSFRTVSTPGNYNNFVGVPRSLFQLEPYHELAVIEMGTSAPGEIRWLSWITQPDIGVITNISEAHLEGLRDVEGVAMAKAELLENIRKGGCLVFNADNPWCRGVAKAFSGRLVSFGLGEGAQIKGSGLKEQEGGSNGGISFTVNGRHNVFLSTPGLHNVYNALAALAVDYCLGLNLEELSLRLGDFHLPPMRMERHSVGGITIINDAYNANPASMAAALAEFSRTAVSGQKCLICGDMAELGTEAVQLHMELGERIALAAIDLLLVTGRFANEVARGAQEAGMQRWQIQVCDGLDEVCNAAAMHLKEGDTVLLKGSRCMHLEEVCGRLKEFFAESAVTCGATTSCREDTPKTNGDKVLVLSEEGGSATGCMERVPA